MTSLKVIRKSKSIAAILLALLLLSPFQMSESVYAREFSKAGSVFKQVKDGVVTIFSSWSHGSGFLVDDSGLVITNSHVIRESADHLRVKFGSKEILEAKVIINDREHDIAILQVNLKNLKGVKSLQLFDPGKDKLVLVGEKVIAIGTPLEKETMEKTMTEGVVSKFDGKTIFHDASISKGNSGGPLINFDGHVVGINTYKLRDNRGPGGAVSIAFLRKSLEDAKKKILNSDPPSAELLPDIPEISYPLSKFLRDNPEFFKNRKQKKYNFSSRYFSISVTTPPQNYAQDIKVQNKVLKKRKKRAQKKGFKISDDEFTYKNLKYHNKKKPVVTITVIPKPKLTAGCLMAQSTGFLAATTLTVFTVGITAPLMAAPFLYNKREVKKDFLKMKLVDEDGKTVATPLETGRYPYERNIAVTTEYTYEELIDKLYVGIYTFDARCFKTDKKLRLVIDVEGNDDDRVIKLPERVKKLIVSDFKPYWDYVANINKEIPAEKIVEATVAQEKTAKTEEDDEKEDKKSTLSSEDLFTEQSEIEGIVITE